MIYLNDLIILKKISHNIQKISLYIYVFILLDISNIFKFEISEDILQDERYLKISWNKSKYLRITDCTNWYRHLSECVCPDRKPVTPLPGRGLGVRGSDFPGQPPHDAVTDASSSD